MSLGKPFATGRFVATNPLEIIQGIEDQHHGIEIGPVEEVLGNSQRQVDATMGAVAPRDIATMDPNMIIDA